MLIYGVKPVGNQCDKVIKLLAEEIWEEFPEVAVLLVSKRYMDGSGQSTLSKEATENLIKKTSEVLAKIKFMKILIQSRIRKGTATPSDF